jgi:predicted Zn finger-like uncharacterized protein
MYTQCPQCQTVFHITMEQLRAHAGVVRCGQCDHVFNADQQLFSEIPQTPAGMAKKPRGGATKLKSAKPKPVTPAGKPPRKKQKPTDQTPSEEIEAAPAPWTPPAAAEKEPRAKNNRALAPSPVTDASAVAQFLAPAVPRQSSFLWFIGILLLALALLAQSAYFYRDRLAAVPELRPILVEICAQLECSLRPPYDASRIELVQPTNIAPHPRYANALRLRATLVNRASKPQPHPLIQVTLTDSGGRVLSRRTFTPSQYLEQRASASTDMPPHLAVSALLDLSNANGKAVGYQMDFFAPPIH